MKTIIDFIKREPVLAAAGLLAGASAFAVPPSAEYLSYIDLRVLCLLFCLMAVVAGFRECGLFEALGRRLLSGKRSFRGLAVLLTALPFFCSMLVTNDVALIAFVPFTILILELADRRGAMIWIISLQTVAANLGSMATPVGNPQNLFLYNSFDLSPGEFFSLTGPLTAVNAVFLLILALLSGKGSVEVSLPPAENGKGRARPIVCAALFVLCLLSVFRVLHYGILTAVVALTLLILSPRLLKQVDYLLLLTFVFFFIFSGNLGRLPSVHGALSGLLAKNVLLCSAGASQVISNVPAAVLLSGLTKNWRGLLAGVDVGGLGTPVASLASLISLKFYLETKERRTGKYLLIFTLINLLGLALLLPIAALIV